MKIHSIIIIATAFLCASLTASAENVAGRYGTDITSDLALIYSGGTQRPAWTAEDLTPYVVHTFADGSKDWFFDAFLFLEFNTGKTNRCFQNGIGKNYSNADDWQKLMDTHFAHGRNLHALDSIIGVYKKELGEPRMRHKIVLGIPAPIKGQTDWGAAGGESLDFNKADDRIKAVKCYIDTAIVRFFNEDYKNIDLAGFYWIEEALYSNGDIVPEINKWIYMKNYLSYWIPYFKDNPFKSKWKEMGFDIAYQQPNYFFDRNIPRSQLIQACDDSKAWGMGLEFEFETQGKCHAQAGDPDSYHDRMLDYIDVFKKKKVFDEASIAWYSGTKGFIDMARSDNPKDKKAMDKIASIVASRQAKKAAAFRYPVNQVRDLALIYQGANYRIDWNREQFRPYVVHTFADGSKDWIYDGFLFLDFCDGMGTYYIPWYGAEGARRSHWEWYLGRLFEKDKSLDALDKCIEEYKKEIGDPGFKHKVVLTMFTPIKGLKTWGEVDGKKLDFDKDEDMVTACRWFLDRLIEGFNDGHYKNLDFVGVYWLDEDMCHTGNISAQIAPYIKEKGLEFSWIPYFKARGFSKWKDYGFDIVYMQPNHFFNSNISDKRLDEACDFAKRYGIAMEFECDKEALSQHENSKIDRMNAYIDAYERNGVWNQAAIAHYTGCNLLLDFVQNPSPENQAVADRYCRHIADRRHNKALVPKKNKKKK